MKIYTKTGDAGETGLFGGGRVAKDHIRVSAYGDLDELNAAIGFCRAQLTQVLQTPIASMSANITQVDVLLGEIQDQLFVVGAELATPHQAKAHSVLPPLELAWVESMERAIDSFTAQIPPLKLFVLPGGSVAASAVHVARTVCRRAERSVVALAKEVEFDALVIPYLNRLSDFLFTAARFLNHCASVEEPVWDPKR